MNITPLAQATSSLSRRTLLIGAAGLTAGLALPALGVAGAALAAPALLPLGAQNPLIRQRADPHINRHPDGRYLFTASVPEYDRIVLRAAPSLAGLATATERTLWVRPPSGTMGGYIWAPEIHQVGGRWYIYFAAGDAGEPFRVRPYVLQADGPDPMTANWTVRGRIVTQFDTFSLDATTFSHNGRQYLVWAQGEPGIDAGSNLYISEMSDPSTLTGPQTRISVPTASWETRGFKVNEGPSVIIRNDRVFISFSASATDANYCLGLLTANASADLLSANSWVKSSGPVFVSNDATSQYGPGHNCFTTAPDGRGGEIDVLVYHAREYRDIPGDPLFDPNRHARVQRLYWNADGTPDFGIPVAAGILPSRLRSHNFPDRFVRHANYVGRLDAAPKPSVDSWFRVVEGLAGGNSLESANFPGHYLLAGPSGITLARSNNTPTFAAAASFTLRAGLADAAKTSFESIATPGTYLRHRDYRLYVERVSGTVGAADATFAID
ncbi:MULTISPECIES: family 43 glycosylhydrolase [Plantibacter]|uniref:family 43 glycosylhydrolase n=2 Tax=Microbacteriaceae TaxID=85023 RepID=UPI0018D7276B|nr:family 43 glycosylhydrolase [Plantibacter flavus]